MRQKITDVAIELMQKRGDEFIGYESFGLLCDVWHECFARGIVKEIGSRSGRSNPHPMNRNLVVLNALDKDDRFEKFYIRCCGGREDVEARVRSFKLKTPFLKAKDVQKTSEVSDES